MQNRDPKPIQGWKAASIMLGIVGVVLLAAWVMTSSDTRTHSIAMSSDAAQTVGVAPSTPAPASR